MHGPQRRPEMRRTPSRSTHWLESLRGSASNAEPHAKAALRAIYHPVTWLARWAARSPGHLHRHARMDRPQRYSSTPSPSAST